MKKIRLLLPLILLAAFGGYSTFIVVTHGYFGFIALAAREPWAMQMLVDLIIACTLVVIWMVPDARSRQIPVWPYLIATVFLGSVGPLGYLVHRGVRQTQGNRLPRPLAAERA